MMLLYITLALGPVSKFLPRFWLLLPYRRELGIWFGGREEEVGDRVPGFDMRLVNGSTINSTELVSAEKPAFYFFFATW